LLRRRVPDPDPDRGFDDVLQDMLEEEHFSGNEIKTSYDELVRWCGIYPQHREGLADYFVTSA
jgi:hypothetical protein